MLIMINLDVMMVNKKIYLQGLAKKVYITNSNLSILKNEKAKTIRFSILESICKALDC